MTARTARWRDDIPGGPPKGQEGQPVRLTGRTRRERACQSGVMVETVGHGWWDTEWFVWSHGAPGRTA